MAVTYLPYVYPFALFLVGLFLYLKGVIRYWINHHTIYYVTNRRVAHAYKSLWLDTTEIPVGSIKVATFGDSKLHRNADQPRNQQISSPVGISDRHTVRMQEIF